MLECLRIGFQAPNGGNLQRYRWVLVDDPSVRAAMAAIVRDAMGGGTAPSIAGDRMVGSILHLRDHLHEVPVLVVPTIQGRLDGAGTFKQATLWGSVLPAVWNFMLALRTRGLGSAWTTIHLRREREMAELLGIPHDEVTQAGLFPVAYTIGTDFRPADRTASESTVTWNHW